MIVVAGESLVDLVVRPDGSVAAIPGGGPSNVARALGQIDDAGAATYHGHTVGTAAAGPTCRTASRPP